MKGLDTNEYQGFLVKHLVHNVKCHAKSYQDTDKDREF